MCYSWVINSSLSMPRCHSFAATSWRPKREVLSACDRKSAKYSLGLKHRPHSSSHTGPSLMSSYSWSMPSCSASVSSQKRASSQGTITVPSSGSKPARVFIYLPPCLSQKCGKQCKDNLYILVKPCKACKLCTHRPNLTQIPAFHHIGTNLHLVLSSTRSSRVLKNPVWGQSGRFPSFGI